MAIVNTTVPTTPAVCGEALSALAARYPFLQAERLTTTAFGRPVYAVSLGCGPRKVLCTGAHHANEWITATLLLKFLEDLCRAFREGGTLAGVSAAAILETATIHTVPMVDPDGVALVTGEIGPGSAEYEKARQMAAFYPGIPFPQGWKADLLGVDLNLQYPAGWLRAREIKFSQGYTRPGPRDYVGRSPLSQREPLALAAYTEQLDPQLVIAWHTQGREIYWQYQDYAPAEARALGEEFARVSGYDLADTPYSSSFAGYKDWFIQEFRRPGFTVEAGLGENPLPLSQFPTIYRDNLGIFTTAAMGLSTKER